MDVVELIDNLEDAIERGATVPLMGKAMLDRDELLDILQEIRLQLPDDLKQAKWVKEERQRILSEAQKEANTIIKSAEEKIISMINEHEITKRSYETAKKIEQDSRKKSMEIKNGTTNYVEEMLGNAEKVLEETLKTLKENRNSMRASNSKRAVPQDANE